MMRVLKMRGMLVFSPEGPRSIDESGGHTASHRPETKAKQLAGELVEASELEAKWTRACRSDPHACARRR
jgi:hypothetical protein